MSLKDTTASNTSPNSAVNQPLTIARVPEPSTQATEAQPDAHQQQLSQQADGGAKTAVHASRKDRSPPPGFEKLEAPVAAAANGAKSAVVPIPSAWFKSKALQPTAAAFDPTAGAVSPPQPGSGSPTNKHNSQQPEEEQQVRSEPIDDQGTKRSRTDQSPLVQRALKPYMPPDAAPQLQQGQREEDVQMARSQESAPGIQQESPPAPVVAEAAETSQQGPGSEESQCPVRAV